MAHLLGSKSCLECLARDVEDIQKTINDCMERIDVDSTNIQSWKFPDKLSHELDIEDLLKTYSFSNDPEFDRLAHIVLFELVIDRLVFLVQMTTEFLDGICLIQRKPSSKEKPKNKLIGSTMSIGLAVKKFWNKAAHVSHTVNKVKQKAKEKTALIPKMGNTITSLQEDNDVMRDVLLSMRGRRSVLEERSESAMSATSNASFVIPTSKSSIFRNGSREISDITVSIEDAAMSKVMSNTATQTFDTAFVACEACAHMQQNLIDVGTAMISLCESQGLQSSLARQKRQLKKSLMAVTDINRWTTEQNRDIERINKHLEYLFSEIEPLKSELEKSRQANRKLREQVKELKSGKEGAELVLLEKEQEFDTKMEVFSNERERSENTLKEEVNELKSGKENVESRLTILEEENKDCKKQNRHLEVENAKINANLKEERSEKERLKEFEKEFLVIKEELATVRGKLSETEVELGKAQTENKALTKHGKTIQVKQEMLLQRADQLDQECEELQNRLLEMEDEKERLLDENETLKSKNEVVEKSSADLQALIDRTAKEKETLENDVKTLQKKVTQLEAEIQSTMKQLTLLSEFPVIGHTGGGETTHYVEETLMEKKGFSLSDEMAKQVKANNIRIAVLEEQNNSLRHALARYEECSAIIPSEIPKDRVPLWESGLLTQPLDSEENMQAILKASHSSANELNDQMKGSHIVQNVVKTQIDQKNNTCTSPTPKPPSQPRTVTSKLNEKRQVYTSGVQKSRGNGMQSNWSDVAIVTKGHKTMLKNIETDKRITAEDDYEKTEYFSCPDCDKIYANRRDLQIHKSFCYANI